MLPTGRRNVGRPRGKRRQEDVRYEDGANRELLAREVLAAHGENGDECWALSCSILQPCPEKEKKCLNDCTMCRISNLDWSSMWFESRPVSDCYSAQNSVNPSLPSRHVRHVCCVTVLKID